MLSGIKIVAKDDVERDLRREAKKAKKEAKKAKKEAKRRRKDARRDRDARGAASSSDDDSGSDSDGHPARDASEAAPGSAPASAPGSAPASAPASRDLDPADGREAWMGMTSMGEDAAKSRDPRSSAQRRREEELARQAEVASQRELNPYWRDGGDGKPTAEAEAARAPRAPGAALLTPGGGGGVGDGGASWRLKALRRAKERAAEEGRSLADVVGDRWGSVAQLVESIGDRAAPDKAHFAARRGDGNDGGAGRKRQRARDDDNDDDIARARARQAQGRDGGSYLDGVGSSGRARMRKPGEGVRGGAGADARRLREDDRRLLAAAARGANSFASDGSFMASFRDEKAPPGTAREKGEKETTPFGWTPGRGAAGWGGEDRTGSGFGADGTEFANEIVSEEEEDEKDAKARDEETANNANTNAASAHTNDASAPDVPRRATVDRASAGVAPAAATGNASAAAALRARLMGGSAAVGTPGPGAGSSSYAAGSSSAHALPSVAADGRAAPGAFGRATTVAGGVAASVGATRRAPRTTQRCGEDGVKSRYYRDDDDASLGDLVAAAKHGGGEDYDANLAENIAKSSRFKGATTTRARDDAVDDEYENDEGLEMYERREKRQSLAKQQSKATQRQVDAYRRSERRLRRCAYCLDAPERPKHLHVAYGNLAYLSLPHAGRLVPGHCVIAPVAHVPSTRAADEDAWEEIRNFKKCLARMFAAKGMECCFFETATRVGSGVLGAAGGADAPHAVVECVPLPEGAAARAPMYFKKAIDESESEWSTHDAKKCISTAPPKGLRGAVPPNFPYFHVEFGMRGGYVHVIDDETRWRRDFARDILAGLLDLPPETGGAKKRPLAPATLKREMDQFLDAWDPVDWTKQL